MVSYSSFSVQQKHQVFISFRGEDTRNNITSHLYAALKQKGIDTFIDNQLERGEEISLALLTAINESMISIIVLSENYASSSWCLDELSKILECRDINRQIVIPIFYSVDPSDIRNLRGSFAEAFAKHQIRFKDKMDKVERWRAALVEVANLGGHHYQRDRPESELIQLVVKDIWVKLNSKLTSDVEGLVGMESRIEDFEKLLDHMDSNGVCIIGIWGMPGVGKTTTAETLFKHISSQFEASYFLANVREKSIRQGLECVRNELFSELSKENLKIGTPSIKGTFVTHCLGRRKVLIVLDDVNNSRQVEYLIGDGSSFSPGSTIIITSRDKQVFEEKADIIYKVEKLTDDQAFKLFIQFALRGYCSIEEFMLLSIRVVRYADGIPLALKILGSFLYGKSERTWESALGRLEKAPNMEIHNVLRISYDGLEDEEKKIFLDVACFFKGDDRNHITNILDGCGLSTEVGISVLIDKSLITISKNKLQMHDLIQEMGWEIVRQESKHPGMRSRLWMDKDIIDVLTTNKVTKTVEGIFLNMSKIKEMCINPQAFENMSELRLLKIYNPHSQEDYKVHLPDGLQIHSKKLAHLHWHCYPLESLPLNFDPKNLVELHMHYSRVIQLWKGVQKLEKLKWIDLSYSKCLKEMPNLSEAPHLERINCVGCTSLLEIPLTTRSLAKLKAVYLSGCSNLKKFPMLSKNVEELHLDGTAIEGVPSEIQRFSRLVKLNMKNCKRLKHLPSILHKLESLEFLDLSGCSSLMDFPEISWNLKELILNETAIELSSSIVFLGKLVSLKLQNCMRLKYLPSSISELKSLESLDLSGCSNLNNFAEIPCNVEKLYLGGTVIEQLPSTIGCLSKLKLLDMKNCTRLKYLPRSICNLKSLEELNLSGCPEFERFPEIRKPMGGLKNLYLDGTAIKELPESIQHLSGLSSLELGNCKNLEVLPNSTTKLKFLENLNLSGCSKLVILPDNLERLKSLQVLKASGCKVQNSVGLLWPSLLGLLSLKTLHLSDCNLQYFPAFCMFSLEELDVSRNKFQSIPADFKLHHALEFLQLSYCESLRQLSGLPSNLVKLDAHGCTSLEEVSNIEFPQSYSGNDDHFVFTNCFKLNQNARRNIEVSALNRIENLASLVASQLAIWSTDPDLRCYVAATNPTAMSLIGIRPCAAYCFPGDRIPEWFDHQNDGPFLTVWLPLHLVQFALCAVIAFEDYNDDGDFKIRCEVHHQTYHLKGWSGQKGKPRSITSDHVFMWYDSSLTLDDATTIQTLDDEVEPHDLVSQCLKQVSIRVYPVDKDDNPLHCCKVTKFGVRILSDKEHKRHDGDQTFMFTNCINLSKAPLIIQQRATEDVKLYNEVISEFAPTTSVEQHPAPIEDSKKGNSIGKKLSKRRLILADESDDEEEDMPAPFSLLLEQSVRTPFLKKSSIKVTKASTSQGSDIAYDFKYVSESIIPVENPSQTTQPSEGVNTSAPNTQDVSTVRPSLRKIPTRRDSHEHRATSKHDSALSDKSPPAQPLSQQGAILSTIIEQPSVQEGDHSSSSHHHPPQTGHFRAGESLEHKVAMESNQQAPPACPTLLKHQATAPQAARSDSDDEEGLLFQGVLVKKTWVSLLERAWAKHGPFPPTKNVITERLRTFIYNNIGDILDDIVYASMDTLSSEHIENMETEYKQLTTIFGCELSWMRPALDKLSAFFEHNDKERTHDNARALFAMKSSKHKAAEERVRCLRGNLKVAEEEAIVLSNVAYTAELAFNRATEDLNAISSFVGNSALQGGPIWPDFV